MVRSADPFWNDVEDMNNGGMKCRFCGHLFSRKTSISRIRWHLSGLKRGGVKICEKVPEEVQDAARAAIDGPPKKRNKYEITNEEAISPGLLDRWMDSMIHDALENDPMLGGRSSPELCSPPVNNDIVTMNDVQNAVHDAGRIPVGVQGTENGMGNTGEEGSIQHVDRSFSLGRHTVDAHENRGEATQGIDVVNQSAGFSMEEEDDVEDTRGRLVQPGAGTSSSRGLEYNTSESRGDPIPLSSTKLVGRAFEENKNVILSLLMDDKFSTISIYGMGGVGKTIMLQHIHNELLKRRDISCCVYWVTVSRDCSINRLQNLVATCLDLDLSREDDNVRRAVKLSKEEETKMDSHLG